MDKLLAKLRLNLSKADTVISYTTATAYNDPNTTGIEVVSG